MPTCWLSNTFLPPQVLKQWLSFPGCLSKSIFNKYFPTRQLFSTIRENESGAANQEDEWKKEMNESRTSAVGGKNLQGKNHRAGNPLFALSTESSFWTLVCKASKFPGKLADTHNWVSGFCFPLGQHINITGVQNNQTQRAKRWDQFTQCAVHPSKPQGLFFFAGCNQSKRWAISYNCACVALPFVALTDGQHAAADCFFFSDTMHIKTLREVKSETDENKKEQRRKLKD